jgi:hypothetical protein
MEETFCKHLFEIAVADRIPAVPATRPQDHLAPKMTPLEIALPIPRQNPQFPSASNLNPCNKARLTAERLYFRGADGRAHERAPANMLSAGWGKPSGNNRP